MATFPPPQEVDSRFRFGWLLAAGFIVAIFLLIGVAISAVLHSAIPKFFESHAVVLIERRSPLPEPDNSFRPDDVMIRHDQLICEDNIVKKVLIKYDLNELATLRDLPLEDQILHIQNNLDVQPSEETDNLYQLRFRSRDAMDAQMVLATLVSTYEKHWVPKYRFRGNMRELLLKMKKRFADELVAQTEKVEEVERQIAAGQNVEDNQAKLKEYQKDFERIQSKFEEASRQYAVAPEDKEPEGFKFTTLSPASKGVSTTPPLYVFLLVGGGGGAMVGLVIAGLMLAVLSNRT